MNILVSKMKKFIIEIQVEYENGKTPSKTIDLTNKILLRGIDPSSFNVPYNVSSQSGVPVSGGSITLDDQNIMREDGVSISPASFNVRCRYDETEKLWNVDIFVDEHNPELSWKDKRLIRHCEHRIHKEKMNNVGDSPWIKVSWSLNGHQQDPVEATRPARN